MNRTHISASKHAALYKLHVVPRSMTLRRRATAAFPLTPATPTPSFDTTQMRIKHSVTRQTVQQGSRMRINRASHRRPQQRWMPLSGTAKLSRHISSELRGALIRVAAFFRDLPRRPNLYPRNYYSCQRSQRVSASQGFLARARRNDEANVRAHTAKRCDAVTCAMC